MTPFEVDAFIAARPKSLDADPEWRDGNRIGEKRCSIPVAVAGSQSPISLEMTVRLSDPEFLMALLLVKRKVICRLCMTTGHFDRETGKEIEGSHFHSWQANRPAGQTLPRKLRHGAPVPERVAEITLRLLGFWSRTV